MVETHRILVVEDDPNARERITSAVEALDHTILVGTADNVADGISALDKYKPDVLLVDLGLPDGDGAQVIRHATEMNVLSMVVSVFGDEESVLRAIRHGASGYLLKDSELDSVRAALDELIAGGSPMTPSIARHVLRSLQSDSTVEADEDRPALTDRETEVLEFVARGFKFSEIAKYLSISTHTVGNHIRKVYKKLNVSSRSEAVFEAVQWGLISIKE